MRTCEYCERLTPAASLSCERCYCGPQTIEHWRNNPTSGTKGWGIAAAIGVVLATLTQVAADLLPPLIGPGMAEDGATRDAAYAMFLLLNVASVVMFIGAGVLVIAWMWLTVRNESYFPRPIENLRAGWAVGGWFIPIANFVLPLRVMQQIVREELSGRWAALAVTWWWIAYVGNGVLTFLVTQGVGVSPWPSPAESWQKHGEFFSGRMGVGLMSAILVAAAGYLLVVLLVGVSLGQTRRIQQAKARRAAIA